MDLYADLELGDGATTALSTDASGKAPKVWATGIATIHGNQPQTTGKPPAIKTNRVGMVPAALAGRAKSPNATGSFSLGFKPAALTRKQPPAITPSTLRAFAPASTDAETGPRAGATGAAAAASTSAVTAELATDNATPPANGTSSGAGIGFVAATAWTHVTVQKENQHSVDNAAGAQAGQFFQSTYRDEYHPARPNSYEAFCAEREAKQKLERVKRDLERRQREQEIESKREREQLLKEVTEGKTPTIAIPASAGRGRGMTVPAWMRKKIEERETTPNTTDQAPVITNPEEGQFDDPPAQARGLGFASDVPITGKGPQVVPRFVAATGALRPPPTMAPTPPQVQFERDEFGRERVVSRNRSIDRNAAARVERDTRRDRERSRREHQRSRSREVDHSRRSLSATYNDRGDRHDRDRKSSMGRVILLQNMVGPGDVDDELEEEVKDECQSKYGQVRKCVVHELRGRVRPEEAVRIFVQFERRQDAEKALQGLNARFFGGRRVNATLYDDEKFDRREFTG